MGTCSKGPAAWISMFSLYYSTKIVEKKKIIKIKLLLSWQEKSRQMKEIINWNCWEKCSKELNWGNIVIVK